MARFSMLMLTVFVSARSSYSAPIVIDDFSVGPIEVNYSETTPLRIIQSGLDDSHVLFGNRSAAADPFNRPRVLEASMAVNIDRQEFIYRSETPLEAFALNYRQAEGVGEYADFSAFGGQFVVDFSYFTTPFDLQYDLYLSLFDASGAHWQRGRPLVESPTPFQLIYDVDSATIDLSSVRSVSLLVSGSPGGEFAIRRVAFVPEPILVLPMVIALSVIWNFTRIRTLRW